MVPLNIGCRPARGPYTSPRKPHASLYGLARCGNCRAAEAAIAESAKFPTDVSCSHAARAAAPRMLSRRRGCYGKSAAFFPKLPDFPPRWASHTPRGLPRRSGCCGKIAKFPTDASRPHVIFPPADASWSALGHTAARHCSLTSNAMRYRTLLRTPLRDDARATLVTPHTRTSPPRCCLATRETPASLRARNPAATPVNDCRRAAGPPRDAGVESSGDSDAGTHPHLCMVAVVLLPR